MLITDWIVYNHLLWEMLVCACLFVPWKQRRPRFPLRAAGGVVLMFCLSALMIRLGAPIELYLLLCTALTFLLLWFCFDCTPLHATFYTTCAYAAQHMASKLAYMVINTLAWRGISDSGLSLVILAAATLAVCLPLYLRVTRRLFSRGKLIFDHARTVLYAALFLVTAVWLSVILENGLDTGAASHLRCYLALNAICILFAASVLALEFSNCSIKHLEQENLALARLLELDKQNYEQAKQDMEKINIRYHDLKQQYSRATDEERARLEEEMQSLHLRYFTGNKALDIVLTQKAKRCEEAGIQLICSADGSCLDLMKPYHIYSMLGNALDNAIECLLQVDDPERRVITVDISRCRDMAVIRVENYTPVLPVLDNGALVTTKQDSAEHGYGTKSIRNIAELYGGTANYFVEDHIFYLVASFPCKEETK